MEINKKVLKDLAKPYKKKIIIASLIIGSVLLAINIFTIGTYHPAQSTIDQLLAQQLEITKEKYYQDMSEKDKLISNLQKQLDESKKNTDQYKKKYQSLQKQYVGIKPPANIKEVKKRLKELGYETL